MDSWTLAQQLLPRLLPAASGSRQAVCHAAALGKGLVVCWATAVSQADGLLGYSVRQCLLAGYSVGQGLLADHSGGQGWFAGLGVTRVVRRSEAF